MTRSLGAILMLTLAAPSLLAADSLPQLKTHGKHLVTDDGETVTLRGVNLGNWLLLEPWMLGLDQSDRPGGFPDQHRILTLLEERFGPARAHELMEAYREHWITPRDMVIIKSFGFNAVRLPFHYRLLEDDAQPMALREDAFKWLDHAIALAEAAGLYVILDLHGVPGGQSIDAPTGQVKQNRLWTDATCQQRTIWLWGKLAERYADHPAVAAYDVVNEPFGDFETDISPQMKQLFGRIHDAIRAADPDTLIYAPGTLQGIGFYGDPADHGWTHVGFTEHAYPGLFGHGDDSVANHARFVAQTVPAKAQHIDKLNVPYLVGEFNVVFDHAGGDRLMRTYFDTYHRLGWAATMWAYKTVKPTPGVEPNNWYLATNGVPFDLNDLNTADDQELYERFVSLSTMPLALDEPLRVALTDPGQAGMPLPKHEAVFEPADTAIDGWTGTDIGGAQRGGLTVMPDGRWAVTGGGRDIWGKRDAFRYVHTPATEDAALTTRVDAIGDTDRYAKAGLMLREDTAADAPHVLLHAFPDGRVVFARRDERGGPTTEEVLAVPGLPVGLALQRDGQTLVVSFTDADGQWRSVRRDGPGFAGGRIGLAVLAHDDDALCRAVFTAPAWEGPPPAMNLNQPQAGQNLLQNASFETVEDAPDMADRARHWNRWGHWLNRQEGWSPTRSGQAILAYHHWQIESADSSGVWQDVSGLKPGQRYAFEVFANIDPGRDDGRPPASVELRLESEQPDGQMLRLATRTYQAKDLATGEDWSRLSLSAEAPDQTMRVLLIVYPNEAGPRDGALKFDDASLRPARAEPSP